MLHSRMATGNTALPATIDRPVGGHLGPLFGLIHLEIATIDVAAVQ